MVVHSKAKIPDTKFVKDRRTTMNVSPYNAALIQSDLPDYALCSLPMHLHNCTKYAKCTKCAPTGLICSLLICLCANCLFVITLVLSHICQFSAPEHGFRYLPVKPEITSITQGRSALWHVIFFKNSVSGDNGGKVPKNRCRGLYFTKNNWMIILCPE